LDFEPCLTGPGFCLIGALGERPQPFFGRGKDPDFGKTYSKIHCLAAALSFSNFSRVGDSE